jgi:hypothetical protein
MKLKGKRVLAIGERDGVSGAAIEACVRSAGRGDPLRRDPLLRLNGRRCHGP